MNNITLFVKEAVKELIGKKKIQKGLNTFGKWEQREQDSTEIVNELRQDKELRYAEGIDRY
jgi:hypothetical protein